jgi:hypothetical protein
LPRDFKDFSGLIARNNAGGVHRFHPENRFSPDLYCESDDSKSAISFVPATA